MGGCWGYRVAATGWEWDATREVGDHVKGLWRAGYRHMAGGVKGLVGGLNFLVFRLRSV